MWLPAALAALFSFKQKFFSFVVFFVVIKCDIEPPYLLALGSWLLKVAKMKPGHVYLLESASP